MNRLQEELALLNHPQVQKLKDTLNLLVLPPQTKLLEAGKKYSLEQLHNRLSQLGVFEGDKEDLMYVLSQSGFVITQQQMVIRMGNRGWRNGFY